MERLAPLRFAEPWDNVGLLLEPVPLAEAPPLVRVLLTIDLSDGVVSEAEGLGVGLIIAYHPPIFEPLKRLRSTDPAEGVLLRCLASRVAVFSPHTALDAAPGGVNDWLLDAFEPNERRPCAAHALDTNFGQGRCTRLPRPISLKAAIGRVKRHLGLAQLRVSAATRHMDDAETIQSIAVCAGAGGALFKDLSNCDLYVTGEMRHHDVRRLAERGSSVILSEHSHTERGFLRLLADRLTRETGGGATFHVSQYDCDPLVLA